MNRLLTKKKDTADAPVHKRTKTWRKKREVEQPPTFDLASALPTADSFRTSLILNGLSTRFSMLREQSDPNSLLGKASDDSVLTGFHLGHIPEASTASLSSFRPPFAVQRAGSFTYGDGYGTDDESTSGSIMSRARPGEGNMLFGGRQKIYRIPIGDAGSVNNLGASESRGGMRGRALYEDDVALTAFQRLREREKARVQAETLAAFERELNLPNDSLNSPSLSYNEKRETISSTTSGPSLLSQSTAATSVHSPPGQSPVMPASYTPPTEKVKLRRLYEQGLEHHIQEQQSAALQRLASMRRNPSQGETPSRARSTSNLRENGTASPVDHRAAPLRSTSSESTAQLHHRPGGSISPDAMSPAERTLYEALDPSQRGMATATGHFSKPKQFSEEQFLQRQLSLMQQKQRPRKASAASAASVSSAKSSAADIRAPSSQVRTARAPSDSSSRFEDAVANVNGNASAETVTEQSAQPAAGTFLADGDDASDYGEEDEQYGEAEEHRRALFASHPAIRAKASTERRRAWSPEELKSGLEASWQGPAEEEPPATAQQSTAPEAETSNLRGLVREHLRHPSNSSSIYPAPRSGAPEHDTFDLRVPSVYTTNNPWDNDEPPPMPSSAAAVHAREQVEPQPKPEDGAAPADTAAPYDWEAELSRHHARGGSTETAHERRAFENELAQRQRTIQENLRHKAGPEPDVSSSAPSSSKGVFENGFRPFGSMLKNKGSREAVSARERGRDRDAPKAPRVSTSKSRAGRDVPPAPPSSSHGAHAPHASQPHQRIPQVHPHARAATTTSHVQLVIPDRPARDADRESAFGAAARHRSGSGQSADGGAGGHHQLPSLTQRQPRLNDASSPPSSAHVSPTADRAGAFSANNTPPLSTVSTPGLSTSIATQSAAAWAHAGHREQTPGFYFPPTDTKPHGKKQSAGGSPKHGPFRGVRGASNTHRPAVLKSTISEPTLIASTSAVSTVDLPPGASLQNGLRTDFDEVLLGHRTLDHRAGGHHLHHHLPVAASATAAPPPSTSTLELPAAPVKTSRRPSPASFFTKFSRSRDADTFPHAASAGASSDGSPAPSPIDAAFMALGDAEPATARFRIRRLSDGRGSARAMAWRDDGAGTP